MENDVIVVIGKSGQLAWELQQLDTQQKLVFFGRNDIDITSPESIKEVLSSLSVKSIINASAYTAVDKAESEPEQAYLINRDAVRNLAEYCQSKHIHLTHVSTDYVFGGDKGSPYLPDDEYNPQSVYGKSKMEGEIAIKEVLLDNSAIIRTSWVYSSHGNNFVKTMLRLMGERDQLSVVDDQIGSPTSAAGLAKFCLQLSSEDIPGVFHYTDKGICSWYDFAKLIQDFALESNKLSKRISITPIFSEQFPTPAKRPSYSVLKDSKVDKLNRTEREHWSDNVKAIISNM
ncbi:dTDP-4-dehydrorhamnose reductase [Psychrosphaera haliotis]|uniref:dTDP-4-dehydrorhamnose reductase n=1 Tax=Psychrosphaera haliotis TaxID=555083 RepID=A0A6N8F970_9GAMM|nr:dTDP-4-dehydrorhamnose reductase [Psychrosphaera haliotis]MUH71382.1 dTDP-4-dehydrorhamnose reductase [Psychrosphaera haliotis]